MGRLLHQTKKFLGANLQRQGGWTTGRCILILRLMGSWLEYLTWHSPNLKFKICNFLSKHSRNNTISANCQHFEEYIGEIKTLQFCAVLWSGVLRRSANLPAASDGKFGRLLHRSLGEMQFCAEFYTSDVLLVLNNIYYFNILKLWHNTLPNEWRKEDK